MCDKIKLPQNFKEIRNDLYDKIIVSEWRDLENIFNDFSPQWIFRGEEQDFLHLISSIDKKRELSDWNWESVESGLLEHYKKYASQNFRNFFHPQNSLEWLSVIQHYVSVTGLLDWTSCPYIASFFAFNDDINNETKEKLLESEYCVVWAINSQWLQKWAYLRITSVQQYCNLSIEDIINPEKFDELFLKSPDLLEKLFVLPVRPEFGKSKFINERMKVQKGLFLRQSDVTDSFENNLKFDSADNYPSADERKMYIKKFLIPKTYQFRIDVLRILAKKGIIKEYLFPGFPGEDELRDECKRIFLEFERLAISIKGKQKEG